LRSFRVFKENFPPVRYDKHTDRSYKTSLYLYNLKDIENIKVFTYEPKTLTDKYSQTIIRYAYYVIKTIRKMFDFVTGYGENKMNERKWLFRFIFLETVAGVINIYQ